jgi:hypothetical protein
MKTVQFTLQERWAASKHMVQKSKKTYTRKDKHKKKDLKGPSFIVMFGSPGYASYIKL